MNIDKCSQFIEDFYRMANSLTQCDLSENKEIGQYEITQHKKLKNLNTKQIILLAQQCFSALKTSCLTDEVINDRIAKEHNANILDRFKAVMISRQEQMDKLADAMESYTLRVARSQPWYIRLLALLGFKTAFEKKISTTFNSSLKREYEDVSMLIALLDINTIAQNTDASKRENSLRKFYHIVLGSSLLKIEPLEGDNALSVAASFLRYLEKFIDQTIDLEEKKRLSQALKELFFAFKIELAIEMTSQYPTCIGSDITSEELFDLQYERLQQIENVIITQLQKLLPSQGNSSSSDHSMILFGGYGSGSEKSGHGVIYQIKKNEAGKFSFQIINSGESAPFYYFFPLIYQDKKKKISQEQENERNDQWQKDLHLITHGQKDLYDLKLTNVNLKKKGFFINLASIQSHIFKFYPIVTSMKEVLHKIIVDLNGIQQDSFSLSERGHKLQKKGNCATKCVTLWLHERLGESLYRRFKTYITEKELEKLNEVKQDYSNTKETFLNLNTIEQMQKEGEKVLKKRQAKVIKAEEELKQA